MKLPLIYKEIPRGMVWRVREEYSRRQDYKCLYCKECLTADPPKWVTSKTINWGLFSSHFLKHPVHLQHCHSSGFTEGTVHAHCNAVLWQYHGR